MALRVPLDSEKAIRCFLSHLTVRVAAHIEDERETLGHDANAGCTTQNKSQRCFFSSTVTDKDNGRLLVAKGAYYILWKENCHLGTNEIQDSVGEV